MVTDVVWPLRKCADSIDHNLNGWSSRAASSVSLAEYRIFPLCLPRHTLSNCHKMCKHIVLGMTILMWKILCYHFCPYITYWQMPHPLLVASALSLRCRSCGYDTKCGAARASTVCFLCFIQTTRAVAGILHTTPMCERESCLSISATP